MKSKGCIFLISARKSRLKECLTHFNENYNKALKYPILIFYHGNKYDDLSFRDSISRINPDVKTEFYKIKAEFPEGLKEEDVFYNLKNNAYARDFKKSRVGYLHASYFWNNFMNYDELKEYDYMMRIDDDSWFKSPMGVDLFEELDKSNGQFGTGFVWNHFSQRNFDTRINMFDWVKSYVEKYDINVKNKQLRDSLKGERNNKDFHTLKWNAGNLNVYNRSMFETDEWKQYNTEFNKSLGIYKYRWVDCEILGLFGYIHLDNPIVDFDLKSKGVYGPQLPNVDCVRE